MWLTDLSPVQLLMLAWLVLQIFSWLTRKNEPPGPPGGRVIAIHSKEEYEREQLTAKESGALVRSPQACVPPKAGVKAHRSASAARLRGTPNAPRSSA